MHLGIDSVYQAPSGALVAFGLIKFSEMSTGVDTPTVGILRLNPFPGGPVPTGFSRVCTAPSASTAKFAAGRGQTSPANVSGSGMGSTEYSDRLGAGMVTYFYAGPPATGPADMDGWWGYNPSQEFYDASTQQLSPGSTTYPAFGTQIGTLATDPSDFAWALSMLPTWDSGRTLYAFNNPYSSLASSSTVSQIATAVPSNNQLWLYALVAAGLGLYYYLE
jgi:hypothetical protein